MDYSLPLAAPPLPLPCGQVFTANMSKKGAPKIVDCKATDNWTSITFKPDLAKFGMDALDDDTVALMRRRVYDLAGVLGKGCKVRVEEGAWVERGGVCGVCA